MATPSPAEIRAAATGPLVASPASDAPPGGVVATVCEAPTPPPLGMPLLAPSAPPASAPAAAAPGAATRAEVRCVARSGESEAVLVPLTAGMLVQDLLQKVRSRVRRVPPADIAELVLDSDTGGRLFEEDPVDMVLVEGDRLITSPGVDVVPAQRAQPPMPAPRAPENGIPRNVSGASATYGKTPYQMMHEMAEESDEEAIPTGLSGDESDESPTPPAPGGAAARHLLPPPPPPPAAATVGRIRTSNTLPRGSVGGEPLDRSRSPGLTPIERARQLVLGPPVAKSVSLGSLEAQDGKRPPLMKAVYDGDLETVEDLLRRGADVNCTVSGGGAKTPIYYAIRFEHTEIARLLVNHPDVDLHTPMKSGKNWVTPVEAAKEGGPTSGVYRIFVEKGLLPAAHGAVTSTVPVVPKLGAAGERSGLAPPPRPKAALLPPRQSYGGVSLASRRQALAAQRGAVYGGEP